MSGKPIDEVIKHWLLNLAVEAHVRLVRLFPEIDGVGLNAEEVPGCGTNDYASCLMELFDSGMIEFISEVPGDEVETKNGVWRVLQRFLNLSGDDSSIYRDGHLLKARERYRLPGMQVRFKLTSRGGEAWEKNAEPKWGRFISVGTYSAAQSQSEPGEVISANRDLVIAYMGWYPEVNREEIQLDTIKWQTHTDFEVLYWKRLPFVYHASFQVRPAEARWNGWEPQWLQDWWVSTRLWHKQPWELPNWPSE